MFRSDPPLPEVFRPIDQTPSAHQPAFCHRPNIDPNVSETLTDSDSDDLVTLPERLKGKTGGVESFEREESPGEGAGSSCPKKPRITVSVFYRRVLRGVSRGECL